MFENVDQLLDALGGTGSVAEALGLAESIVSGWRKRGIPSKRWPALVTLADDCGVSGVTSDALLRLQLSKTAGESLAEARA